MPMPCWANASLHCGSSPVIASHYSKTQGQYPKHTYTHTHTEHSDKDCVCDRDMPAAKPSTNPPRPTQRGPSPAHTLSFSLARSSLLQASEPTVR